MKKIGYIGFIYPILLVIAWIIMLVFAMPHATDEEKIGLFILMLVITIPQFTGVFKKNKKEIKQNKIISQAIDDGYEIIVKKINAKYDVLYTNKKGSFLVVILEFQKCAGNIVKLNDDLEFKFEIISDNNVIGYTTQSIKTGIKNIESVRLEINEDDISCFGKTIKLNDYKNITAKVRKIYHNGNELTFKNLK